MRSTRIKIKIVRLRESVASVSRYLELGREEGPLAPRRYPRRRRCPSSRVGDSGGLDRLAVEGGRGEVPAGEAETRVAQAPALLRRH